MRGPARGRCGGAGFDPAPPFAFPGLVTGRYADGSWTSHPAAPAADDSRGQAPGDRYSARVDHLGLPAEGRPPERGPNALQRGANVEPRGCM